MKEAKSTTRSKNPGGDFPELKVVGIRCNPAPDAQDRLRRLFTLLLEHTAGEGQIPLATAEGLDEECQNGDGG